MAGEKLQFAFRFPETRAFFGAWAKDLTKEDVGYPGAIVIPEEDFLFWNRRWKTPIDAYSEYGLSTFHASERLLKAGKCVFHGTAMIADGKVVLFTAPSGTGKTTQYRRWKKLYGESVEVLNGDKPVLELCADGKVMVHPSPWKGKENMGRDDGAFPLANIICLRQGKENRIEQMSIHDSAHILLGRMLLRFADEESIQDACAFLSGLIRSVPVWRLVNKGDEESAKLTHDTLMVQ